MCFWGRSNSVDILLTSEIHDFVASLSYTKCWRIWECATRGVVFSSLLFQVLSRVRNLIQMLVTSSCCK